MKPKQPNGRAARPRRSGPGRTAGATNARGYARTLCVAAAILLGGPWAAGAEGEAGAPPAPAAADVRASPDLREGAAAESEADAVPDPDQPANLLPNGSFDEIDADTGLPAGWTTKHRENITIVDTGGERGHIVEMTGGAKLMGTYGVDLLSEKVAFKPNTHYRVTGWTRSEGPKLILFVKGYATVHRKVNGEMTTYDDVVYQMKKEIEPNAEWNQFNLDFDLIPAKLFSDHQHEVKYLRLLCWAYWPVGTAWYDDLRFEEVGPAAEGEQRHEKAVTHTGEAARLGDGADAAAPVDVEQAWLDAANAWQSGDAESALNHCDRLLREQPDHADAHVLAARAAGRLGERGSAGPHIDWLRKHTDAASDDAWRLHLATVAEAELLVHEGKGESARTLLDALLKQELEPHVEHAAKQVLKQAEAKEAPPEG